MFNGKRPIVGVVCLIALAALSYGCQVGDGFSPTEADRSIQQAATTCDAALATEIRNMIPAVITDPIVGKSVTSQFNAIVKACPKNINDAKAKTRTTTDFIMKHFAAGKWTDAEGTGNLVAKMFEFVGLLPEAQNATACIPNVDCELTATELDEFAGTSIPGSSITQSFVIYVIPIPDFDVDPPIFGLVYEIGTIPAGITFPPVSPSGSLTLAAEDDQPVVGICTLDSSDPEGVPDGVHPDSLHVVHLVNGEWVRLPRVDITNVLPLDCSTASSTETASLWSNPILEPVLEFLSPDGLVAAGVRTGGAITSFSPHATEVAGTLPTETALSIVGGETTFFVGDTITFSVEVNPEPTGGNVAFYATTPVSGPGAPIVPVVDGVATRSFVCGSNRVPATGTHTAQAQYLGTEGFAGSASGTLQYTCSAGD